MSAMLIVANLFFPFVWRFGKMNWHIVGCSALCVDEIILWWLHAFSFGNPQYSVTDYSSGQYRIPYFKVVTAVALISSSWLTSCCIYVACISVFFTDIQIHCVGVMVYERSDQADPGSGINPVLDVEDDMVDNGSQSQAWHYNIP